MIDFLSDEIKEERLGERILDLHQEKERAILRNRARPLQNFNGSEEQIREYFDGKILLAEKEREQLLQRIPLKNVVSRKRQIDIIDRAKEHPLVTGVLLLSAVIAAIFQFTNAYEKVKSAYFSSLGAESKASRTLEQLAAGVDIAYFEQYLGKPTISDSNDELRGYTFVDPLFYVHVISDRDGRVLIYSVTTRTEHFAPRFPYRIDGLNIILGKTKFSDLQGLGDPMHVIGFLAAHDFFFGEEFYFGNPANYQTYVFSLNEAGHGGWDSETSLPLELLEDVYSKNSNTRALAITRLQQTLTINTYSISAPNVNVESILPSTSWSEFGVHFNQVRILPDAR